MIFVCHTEPGAGESGWMYSLPGEEGSALPVTTHSELWNLYIFSATGTMSMVMMYLASGSRLATLILMTGNILLQWEMNIQLNPAQNEHSSE